MENTTDPSTKAHGSKIVVRRSTAVPKKRSEMEEMLTHSGVERFLKELGKGTVEAEIASEPKEAAEQVAEGHETSGFSSEEKLALGDVVTVRLTNLEFAGIAGLAQMIAAAKAPPFMRPFVEKSPFFGKLGAGLDKVYSAVRSGLTFKSKITEWQSTPEALVYVDEGQELPKLIKSWKHTHRFAEQGEGGLIVDEITVEVEPAIAAPVVEGALRMHLENRAKIYNKVFAN